MTGGRLPYSEKLRQGWRGVAVRLPDGRLVTRWVPPCKAPGCTSLVCHPVPRPER